MIYLLVKFHENWVIVRHVECVGEGVSWETLGDIYIYMPSVYLDIGDV